MSKVTMKLSIPVLTLMLSFLNIGLTQAAPISAVSSIAWGQSTHHASHQTPNQNKRNQPKKLAINSSQQAAQVAKRQYAAKVLSVQSTSVNGSPGYRVKLLSNKGMVFYATVNARTGSVSRN
ncbi:MULTISPECIES: PepSY domain-containing protein [Shewanella]|uniref:PepSY domain-containing protein n=1 Tax=Shewanella TaxID=22 RepID=UPI0006E7181B|nr:MULTISPECIES: PepSY domain-containing protein [Shewanella]KPZ68852.1 hypothetical protein AN944_03263 [Shewanella sp. P1-14-1]